MKKILLFLLTALLFVAGCGGDSNEGTANASTDKVVTVGAVPNGFPHAYKEDGESKGFVVDVFNSIFDELGYEVEWEWTDWNGVLANLQSGKIDTAINFAATEERAQTYNFTDPYYSSKAVVATSKDHAKIHSLDDLEGKQLASIMGTNFENVLLEEFPEKNYELIIYESNDVVYTDVGTGKVDGFIYGREQLLAQISERDIPLQIVGEPFGDQPVALPFHKTEENDALISEINQVIEELKDNGTFSEIAIKWFGVDITKE